MSPVVLRLVLATVAVAILGIAAAIVLFPIRSSVGGPSGIAFWVVIALLASALPVQLPRGTVVSVGAAPILAAAILGGPLAGAIVGAVGTIDSREVRGQIPWYGTLFNHALLAITGVVAGIVFELTTSALSGVPEPRPNVGSFIGAIAAGLAFVAVNSILALLAVSARTGSPIRTVWASSRNGTRL